MTDEETMDDLKHLIDDCEDIRKHITKDLLRKIIKTFDDLSPELRERMKSEPAVIDFIEHAEKYIGDDGSNDGIT